MRSPWLAGCLLPAAIVCLLAVAGSTPSEADPDNRPIVVLRIDDCGKPWNTPFAGLGGVSGLQYGKTKKIPITWAVMSAYAQNGTSLSWAQIKDYLDNAQYTENGVVYAGEPASHSVNHAAMPAQQAYIDELPASKAAIEANLPGYSCNTFLQPGTWTGDAYMDSFVKLDNPIGQAVQANYQQSMSYLGSGWLVGGTPYRYGLSNNWNLDAQSLPTAAAINKRLDVVAATPGCIAIISGHSVQEQGQQGYYAIAADILKATMDKLAELRDQGKIRLMSLHDAYHTTFSSGLNHVLDPGFELAEPTVVGAPWVTSSGASLPSTGGVDNSRYVLLPDTSSYVRSNYMTLEPGRYELKWYQQRTTSAVASLVVVAVNLNQGSVIARNAIDWQTFYSPTPGVWEQKTALLVVQDRLNMTQIRFQPASGGSYGVDNVSLTSAPLDPAVSPSASAVMASPGQCAVSWHTPNDPSITSIVVRYSKQTHPLAPTEGYAFANVTAVANSGQQASASIDWTTMSYAFFSVFGKRADGSYAPPDLVAVKVDRTAPTKPVVTLAIDPDGTIHAQWASSEPDSSIVGYQYAVGTAPGDNSLRAWTPVSESGATITGLPYGTACYVSVKAQNVFGVWSVIGSKLTCPRAPAVTATHQPDGTILAQWTSPDVVLDYRYAVGSAPGANDIQDWVSTTDTSATIAGLAGCSVFVSVESRASASGTWSTPGSALASSAAISVAQAHTHQNTDRITVTGVVTAVFGDCCYIEDLNRGRGIKVTGNISSFHERDIVTVTGQISIGDSNERKITAE